MMFGGRGQIQYSTSFHRITMQILWVLKCPWPMKPALARLASSDADCPTLTLARERKLLPESRNQSPSWELHILPSFLPSSLPSLSRFCLLTTRCPVSPSSSTCALQAVWQAGRMSSSRRFLSHKNIRISWRMAWPEICRNALLARTHASSQALPRKPVQEGLALASCR